ncbi:hypothetical protein CEQ21_05275 [Niallia circulans]|uniref:Uncharacterized protein n=1 Tax=Niallia circulans TaxID=1397 RepID=A0A553STK0_NIACI|nr:hypothetical protein [Niallia circulans]TRZ40327.1 hypothetical protein CEQ21_05275 [Niallia circulans]
MVPIGFDKDEVIVWKKEGNDGLKRVAGRAREQFYPFNSNIDKEENDEDRILIIDSYHKESAGLIEQYNIIKIHI